MMPGPDGALIGFRICDEDFDFAFARLYQLR